MRFGICTPIDTAARAKSAGWEFIEENAQSLLQGEASAWSGADRIAKSALPVLAANSLVPANLKITGPEADLNVLHDYLRNVVARAATGGLKVLVFGSAGARNIPDKFPRDQARQQLLDFIQLAGDEAVRHDVMIAIEPLNKGESNVINSIKEAMTYVRELNHDAVRCLVDSYHFWAENEPLDNLKSVVRWIAHVHVADQKTRTLPGETAGAGDYRSFFQTLKKGGYSGLISVEAPGFKDLETAGARALAFLKKQWNEA